MCECIGCELFSNLGILFFLFLLLLLCVWTDDVGSRRGREVRSSRLRLGMFLCVLGRVFLGFVLFGFGFVLAAVLFDEFHCGVVFGGIFELLDRVGAFLLVGFEAVAEGVDAEGEVGGYEGAGCVYSGLLDLNRHEMRRRAL